MNADATVVAIAEETVPLLRELVEVARSTEAYIAAWDGGPSYEECEERRAEWSEINRRRERTVEALTDIGRRFITPGKAVTG